MSFVCWIIFNIMGLRIAKKYITDLHTKQADPQLWPDFLTGLPDRAASIRKLNEVYEKFGRNAVIYFRIENIEPYLAKYGTDRHVEIIEWAAAILRTTMDNYGGFVGTVGTHEFIAVCRKSGCKEFVEEVDKAFSKRAKDFYKPKDLKNGAVLSFSTNGGKKIRLGLMDLKHCTTENTCGVPMDKFLAHLKKSCV